MSIARAVTATLALTLAACDAPRAPEDVRDLLVDGGVDATTHDGPSPFDASFDAPAADAGIDAPTRDAPGLDAERDDAPSDAPLPALEEGELAPGGTTTTSVDGIGAFVQQATNLTLARRADFEAGRQFFQLEWETAPGRPEADGLGPLYNAASCVECHARNGRGAPSRTSEGTSPGVLLRLGTSSGGPEPIYGDQLQTTAIPGVAREGRARRFEDPFLHPLSDGSERALLWPRYEVSDLGYGPLASDVRVSPRIAQQLVGLGLLEAIDEADIVALTDEEDGDGDGVSGRAHWLDDGSGPILGRFGWKASQPTVESQSAGAFLGDLGITSPPQPIETCTLAQTACIETPSGGSPELTAIRLRVVAAYVRLLGVPPRRHGEDEDVRRGRLTFTTIGCASCHHPSYVTGARLEPELAGQRIWPYTDLLLHDMGPRLADDRRDHDASGLEWRTPPLWGIGLLSVVNGETHLLHDGRARDIDEAVLWHGGEADRARLAYEALSDADRASLARFVESL